MVSLEEAHLQFAYVRKLKLEEEMEEKHNCGE